VKRPPFRHLATTVVLVLTLVLVPSALAGKGGNGGTTTSATLTLSPNPVASWSAFWGSGCGYAVGSQVNIVVTSPYWTAGFPVGVDGTGCIRFQFWVDGPGSYGVKAMQQRKGRKHTVLASASLTVT
jgi:hypothetical protein